LKTTSITPKPSLHIVLTVNEERRNEEQNPTPSPVPMTLASTGSEVEWLILGSLVAISAGADFLALCRHRRTE
jgi:hypothetical protein